MAGHAHCLILQQKIHCNTLFLCDCAVHQSPSARYTILQQLMSGLEQCQVGHLYSLQWSVLWCLKHQHTGEGLQLLPVLLLLLCTDTIP